MLRMAYAPNGIWYFMITSPKGWYFITVL